MKSFILLLCAGLIALPAAETQPSPPPSPADAEFSREARAAICAHHLCSGLWVVGRGYKRTPEEVIAQDLAPFHEFGWEPTFKYEVDEVRRRVTVTAPDAPPRTAQFNGDQGSSILPRGAKDVFFKPIPLPKNLPDPQKQAWPMGDLDATTPVPVGVNTAGIDAALDWGMAQPQNNTRALVVVYRGKIIGERYARGWTKDTPQLGWSAGKSITAALIGILIQQGAFKKDDFAPIKEWRGEDDPRRQIRISDLLQMSSGLDFRLTASFGPTAYTRDNEHFRIYFDGINVFEHAINQPLAVPPGTRYSYRNSDPLALGKIVKDTVEARGEDYLTFPQRALFDRIGARNFVLETDAWGNFIMAGYDYGSARDWARFGLLHLWDGVWQGKRILPEGWVDFISTPAPANKSRGYGGLFWLNRGGAWKGIPEDAFMAMGFMGQHILVVRSRDLVVVRLGPRPGAGSSNFTSIVARILNELPKS